MTDSDQPNVWRLNLVTSADDPRAPRDFCLERNLLGIGWRLDEDPPKALGYREHREWAKDHFRADNWSSYKSAFRALASRMDIGDLCWIRDTDGIYYLAEVTGDWQYRDDDDHRAVDIHHFRKCNWYKIGPGDIVPASVVTSFRGRTLQSIQDPTTAWMTRSLFAEKKGRTPPPPPDDGTSLWSLMTPDDIEDVAAVYLQDKGYVVLPSTAKKSTPAYEFVMINSATGSRAILQAKKSSSLDPASYKDYDDEVFLFTAMGTYKGKEPSKHIHLLDPEELEDFLSDNPNMVSPRVRHYQRILEHGFDS